MNMDHSTAQMGPFAIVPRWLSRSGVSDGALRLYVALADRADRGTGEATFTRRTLAEDMGVTDLKVVTRRVAELERLGAIRVERTKTEDGANEVNRYLVVQIQPRGVGVEEPLGVGVETPPGWGSNSPSKENLLQEPKEIVRRASADVSTFDDVIVGIARVMHLHLRNTTTEARWKRLDPTKWLADIDKLVRLDEVDVDDVLDMVGWLYTSTDRPALFWRTNIRSGAKLRKHWDDLVAQRTYAKTATGPAHVTPAQRRQAEAAPKRLPVWFWQVDEGEDRIEVLTERARDLGMTLAEACERGGRRIEDVA